MTTWAGRSGNGTVHEGFDAQVLRSPDAVALSGAGVDLSYRQINATANAVAHRLREWGVGAEDLVGVCLERDLNLVPALIGVVKAGAAYVPLDPAQPGERLGHILAQAEPRVVVTTSALAPRFAGRHAGPFLLVDVPFGQPTDDGPPPVAAPDNAMYVIYTSGSTGRPKGVTLTHANVRRLFTATRPVLGFGVDDVWSLFHSYAFDVSVWEMWGALLHGGRLVLVPGAVTRSPDRFLDLLVEQRVTVLSQTPSAFRGLVGLAALDDPRLARLVLRSVVFGGEKLLPYELRPWAERFGLDRPALVNMYGITETTVHATSHRIVRADLDSPAASPIGRPFADLRFRLLGPDGRPVPDGEPGEIHVSGPGVARGYPNQPALTAERFVADAAGARAYRSGDLARRLPSGDLDYVGRIDNQVKIRGFRVELGEIESAMLTHPAVSHAAIVARPDQAGDLSLTAYVVSSNGSGVTPDELRAHLTQRLPDYMVPAHCVSVPELPLTHNGKLDSARLPAPTATATGREPRSPREEILCDLFAQVLELPRVGVDDDFVALGGHSLAAIRLTNRIRATLGVAVPIETLLDARTVAALARRMDENQTRSGLRPRPRPDRVPLSLAQQRLWFLYQMEGSSPAYHIPLALHLTGHVDEPALSAAVGDVLARHEILRTTYGETGGEPYQRIRPCPTDPLLARTTTPAELPDLMRREARAPFDLTTDLPLRATLLRVGPDTSVLLLVLHHIAGDGWSLGPLAGDLSLAYTARHAGRAPGWADLPVQYADFALWQHDTSNDGTAGLDHWRQSLLDAPDELDLPVDRPRRDNTEYTGGLVDIDLPPDLHQAVRALARRAGATVHMVLHAVVAALLTRLNAGTDLPMGIAIAGRTDEALENLVGFFVNSLVVRVDTHGDPTFADLIGRVRTASLAAYAHQDVPFERVVAAVNPPRQAGRHPLFQVLVASQNNPPMDFDLPGVRVRVEPVRMGTAKFDLSFKFDERRDTDGIGGELEYSADLFDRATAERIADMTVRVVDAVAADPGVRLSAIDIVPAADRRRFAEWNRTEAGFPDDHTIAELFEHQADRTPDAVALRQQGRTWTFRVLDERANQIAHVLRELGVGPEVRVGISLYRSPELIATMLGVWKAGGAYIPTDPTYPGDRLNYMFTDGGARVLVAEHDVLDRLDPPAGTELVAVDDHRIRAAPVDRPAPLATGRNLAYAIYTSGSTGRPKSVLIEHRSAVNRLCDVVDRFGITGTDISVPVISISFEALVREAFAPLMAGGSVALLPPHESNDPVAVIDTIRVHRATLIMVMVPSLLEAVIAGGPGRDDLASLRLVGTGGEVLRPQDAAVVVDEWGAELVNQYGPTETTMMSCMHVVRPVDLAGPIPIGPPLRNAQVHVLDRWLRPVPVGVTGEMYVTGVGMARGYLGETALTAQRFVANPFGSPGSRLYRSGDLARWRPDGNLDFVGRVDDQVKVRGFRIELGEIEVTLAEHPAIAQAAVIVREDRPGDRRLVAYVVPAAGHEMPEPMSLRDFLARVLPDHMIPAAFLPMAGLPLRGNGKLDRSQLPRPDLSDAVGGRAPRSPRQELLCGLFAEILGLPSVGVDDDFFALGGHSLLAARLISLVRRTLGERLAMRSLFEAPTVAGLVKRFGQDSDADALRVLLPLRPQGTAAPLFCVHPGGGLSWSYVGLLPLLDTDVPVYGLQARGLTEPAAMPRTVDDMAADYLAAIRAVCPDGPYRLLGWSFGGVVAHEMAVRLRESGQDVTLLAMLDSYPDLPAIFRLNDQQALAALLDPDRPDLVPARGSTELAMAVDLLRRGGGALASLDEERIEAVLRTMAHNRQLVRAFVPRHFDGDLLFFGATQDRPDDAPTAADWRQHVGGAIEVHPVDATHAAMTQPAPLRTIGRVLATRLDAPRKIGGRR